MPRRAPGAFVGMTTDWFAVWGQHKQAETNSNWRCGLPEYTWLRVKDTFFPVPGDALKPYPNYWLAGSPYDQCDVISIDDESRVSDLARYGMVAFAGWNTATPEANAVLRRYMENEGGIVVLGVPHLSTRRDREYRAYKAADMGKTNGEVLFAAWDYPGNKGPDSDAYDALLRSLAGQVPQRVTIAPAGDRDDTRYICFSHYKDKAYLLNVDCMEPRTVKVYILHSGRQPVEQVVEIPPCSVKVLDL